MWKNIDKRNEKSMQKNRINAKQREEKMHASVKTTDIVVGPLDLFLTGEATSTHTSVDVSTPSDNHRTNKP